MPDQTLFDNGQNQQETPAPQSLPQDLFANQLKEIVDETGRQKYNTPEDALKALKHSQEYIPSLKGQVSQYEQEIAQLKAELEKRSSVEDIVSRLTNKPQENPQETPKPAGLDETAILAMIQNQLSAKEQNALRTANLKNVSDALTAKFGDKAKEALANKAAELGVTLERMKQMAEETPQLVTSLFNASQIPTPKPTTGGHQLPPQGGELTLNEQLEIARKKVLSSGTAATRNSLDMMRQVKQNVYAQFNVSE